MSRASARGTRHPADIRVDVGRDGVAGGLSDTAVRRVATLVVRAEGARRATMSVTLVSDAAMRRLNFRHLRRRALTDVIAFAFFDAGGDRAGDVYIAPGAARRAAAERGITIREELVRLVVHGVLHVMGHDHPDGPGRMRSAMWRRQEGLVTRALRTLRTLRVSHVHRTAGRP